MSCIIVVITGGSDARVVGAGGEAEVVVSASGEASAQQRKQHCALEWRRAAEQAARAGQSRLGVATREGTCRDAIGCRDWKGKLQASIHLQIKRKHVASANGTSSPSCWNVWNLVEERS